jgi:hypothetical protein
MWLITMMYFWCSLCNFLRVFSLCFSVFSCCLGGSSFFSNLFDYFCLTGWPLTGEITCHTVLGFLPALSLFLIIFPTIATRELLPDNPLRSLQELLSFPNSLPMEDRGTGIDNRFRRYSAGRWCQALRQQQVPLLGRRGRGGGERRPAVSSAGA